jgi:hypothetical protein
MDDLQSISSKSRLRPSDIFTKRSSSLTHMNRKTTSKIIKIKPLLITQLPENTRISYKYRVKNGDVLTFPSAFYKHKAGKGDEYAVITCGKNRRAILISNIIELSIDTDSARSASKIVKDGVSLLEGFKSLEKKIDIFLKRR